MDQKPKTKTRNIRLPVELDQEIAREAKESNRSFSGFINWLLRSHVEQLAREREDKKGRGEE